MYTRLTTGCSGMEAHPERFKVVITWKNMGHSLNVLKAEETDLFLGCMKEMDITLWKGSFKYLCNLIFIHLLSMMVS